jgi:hypothetical protein
MTTAILASTDVTPAAVEFALLRSWLASRSVLKLLLHEIESRQQNGGREVQRLLLQAHLQQRGKRRCGSRAPLTLTRSGHDKWNAKKGAVHAAKWLNLLLTQRSS